MAAVPLSKLELRCTSIAEHLGFLALSDVAIALANRPEGRVIGGHMVTLHVLRWGLDLTRATQDADLGVQPAIVQTPDLTDRLLAVGYSRTAGNRFERPVSGLPGVDQGPHNAVIDILVPAYTSRARENRAFGDHLVTTEVPGLAFALKRAPVDLELDVTMLDGAQAVIPVRLPDEVSALVLKIMARTVRTEDRDAVDVWRALEVCQAAGIRGVDFGPDGVEARRVLAKQFGRGGPAIREISQAQNLSNEARTALDTRLQALLDRVVGEHGRVDPA
jgi:hypothetical protein